MLNELERVIVLLELRPRHHFGQHGHIYQFYAQLLRIIIKRLSFLHRLRHHFDLMFYYLPGLSSVFRGRGSL